MDLGSGVEVWFAGEEGEGDGGVLEEMMKRSGMKVSGEGK